MPRYEYRCRDCSKTFERQERMADHDSEAAPSCPHCGSRETERRLSPFFPETSDKT